MIINNFKYLTSLTGKTQRNICVDLKITESAVWQWGRNTKPTKNTLRRIARYFSETLSIPYDLFDDGKALLDKNFEEILLQAQILPVATIKKNSTVQSISTASNPTNDEQDLIDFLRKNDSGSNEIPLSPAAVNTVKRLIHSLGGINSKRVGAVIDLCRGLEEEERVLQKRKNPDM